MMSAPSPSPSPSPSLPGAAQTLHVRAVFHGLDSNQAELIAAEMVARAHELANTPACECDVDVNIESLVPGGIAPEVALAPLGGESPSDTARPSATGAVAPSAR